ncbi:MAG: tRNA (adenosine(37)-N6)-threonylcarbamoyltransferase complex dimerization subunit type 1 TsaB, partial [Pygmaiobacter sp.]
AGVAILRDGALLYEAYLDTGLTHSETLVPLLKNALATTGIALPEVGLFAVSAGPGSFTGLRIGMALVKGLALPGKTPCVGVSTLEALARSCYFPQESLIVSSSDARRGEVYYAVFEQTAAGLCRLCEDAVGNPDELLPLLENCKKTVFLIGDGAKVCYNKLEKNKALTVLPEEYLKGRAFGVAFAARAAYLRGEAGQGTALVPEYHRLSQAQRERQERLKGSEAT